MTSRLMIPGPVPLDDCVSAALAEPVQAHYGPTWVAIYNNTLTLLGQVFRTGGDVFCIPGSGSAGLDAALGSVLSPGRPIVVGVNGAFGERLAAIARAHGAEVVEVKAKWGEPLLPAAFDDVLGGMATPVALALTHVETSTAVVNPVREIAQVARDHAVPVIVDGVSAVGGVDFAMDAWGVALCVTASQKCLGAPAGLALVAVSPRGWEAIDRRPNAARSWYLDLNTWRTHARDWAAWHPYPVTMPTHLVVALQAALRDLLRAGLAARFAHYRDLANRLRAGLRGLGLQPLVADEWAAPVLTAVVSPSNIPVGEIVTFVEQEHGIRIAGGLGRLSEKVFRIGHMGPNHTVNDIEHVLAALEDLLRRRRP